MYFAALSVRVVPPSMYVEVLVFYKPQNPIKFDKLNACAMLDSVYKAQEQI